MSVPLETLTPSGRTHIWSTKITIATAAKQAEALISFRNPIKINRITFVYVVASDGAGTIVDHITVGTAATPTMYADYLPVISQALGTVVHAHPTVATVLPAKTPLIVTKSAADAQTNTAVLSVNVEYQFIDTTGDS